jgi:ABC-2 type transport system ATP-binding protein
VIANDSLEAVRRLVPAANLIEVEIQNPGSNGWYGSLRGLPGVETVEVQGNLLRVGMGDLTDTAPAVLEWIRSQGYRYTHLATQRADLETVFLTLTGRSVRNA